MKRKPMPKERVLKKIPRAGAMLSAMWGWIIMDYTDDDDPVAISSRKGKKTEALAWQDAARRL